MNPSREEILGDRDLTAYVMEDDFSFYVKCCALLGIPSYQSWAQYIYFRDLFSILEEKEQKRKLKITEENGILKVNGFILSHNSTKEQREILDQVIKMIPYFS